MAENNPEELSMQMSFMQHLDALRWHLVRSAIAIVLFAVVLFCFNNFLFDTVIFGPLKQDFISYRALCSLGYKIGAGDVMCMTVKDPHLQTLSASEQFFTHMWIALLGGIILAFPYVLYELWKFIRPALKNSESQPAKWFVIIASILFLIGIFFGYFLLFPMSYNFLINYQLSDSGIVQTNNTLDDYISLISTMVLVSGIVFELPVLVYFLTRLGLLTPEFMRKYRKYAVVVILIAAAVITPSPDVTSQMVVAVPMYLLYEISIFVSAFVIKKNKLN
ncbi:MAG: twin-arginine translocase subunit TatC [Bacteroidota bacterium]